MSRLQLSFRDTEHPQGWSLYRAFALVLLLSKAGLRLHKTLRHPTVGQWLIMADPRFYVQRPGLRQLSLARSPLISLPVTIRDEAPACRTLRESLNCLKIRDWSWIRRPETFIELPTGFNAGNKTAMTRSD